MATTKFTKIYTGKVNATVVAKSAAEAGSLCIDTLKKLAYQNGKQILGNFDVVASVDNAKEQGVLYYIPATGTKGEAGYKEAKLGYWDGTAFVSISDDADFSALEARVKANEDAITKLNGADTVDGSVAKSIKTAVEGLTGSATIASKDATTGVVTLKAGVAEADGKISNNTDADIVLAKVATTGDAEDVKYGESSNVKAELDKIEGADTVDGSIAKAVKDAKAAIIGDATTAGDTLGELEDRIEALDSKGTVKTGDKILSQDKDGISSTLTITVEKQGEEGAQKDYIVLKGVDGTEVSKVDASTFVKDGMLEKAEYKTGDATHAEADGPYIVLTWNTDGAKEPMWISVKGLVDVYTGTTDEIVVTNNVISLAKAVKDAIKANADAIDVLNGADTVDGSVAKAIKGVTGTLEEGDIKTIEGLNDAIAGMDGSATIASKDATTGVVTLKAGVAQTNGEISNSTDADIVLAKVATTGKAEDVTTAAIKKDGEDYIPAGTAQSALEALAAKIQAAAAGGVQDIEGKAGSITLDKDGTAADAVKFAISEGGKISGTVHYGALASDGTTTTDGIAKVSEVAAAVSAVNKTVVEATAGQEVTVTESDDKKTYTVGVTKATYTATAGVQNDTVSDAGLVDGKMLKDYVEDYAIYWEELA